MFLKVKSPNNTSKWKMGFNSAFKGLTRCKDHMNVKFRKNISNAETSLGQIQLVNAGIHIRYTTKRAVREATASSGLNVSCYAVDTGSPLAGVNP